MYCNEITGIHIGENCLEYSNLKRVFKGWRRTEPAFYAEISGRNGLERLESLLVNLKPRKTRRICISIPATRYFLRELSFPGLNPQEAENSVRIAIGMHSHLPREQIYFDVWPLERNGVTCILLAYIRRSCIDPILDVIKRTGHRKSLYCICPSGLGADLFLRFSKHVKFPALSMQQEDKELVLNLHGQSDWEGSHVLREKSAALTPQKALEFLPGDFQGIRQIFQIGDIETIPAEMNLTDPCLVFEELKNFCSKNGLNKGLTACFAGTCSYPQISFQDSPRKRPWFLGVNTFQWAVAVSALMLLLFTGMKLVRLERLSSMTGKNQEVVSRLEKQYVPLRKVDEKIEKIKQLEQDVHDFLRESPPVLVILKELADRTPLNAWIRSCTIRGRVVRVSAEGGSAVETMEKWRKSSLFSEVKLESPVTKNRKQQERYTVALKLKTKSAAGVKGRSGKKSH